MSKNFEVLQRAEQDAAAAAALGSNGVANAAPVWTSAPSPSMGNAAAVFDMDERSREQVAKLVHHLFLLPGSVRALVLAGVEAGEGCSWMAVHCARMLAAQVSASVCVVDANLHTPALHRYFGVANHYGLSDALRQSGPLRDFVQLLDHNLWLMSCGSQTEDGRGLMGSEALRRRLIELRSQFDYLIIDAPPLNLYSDAIVVGQAADGLALVVAEHSTRRESARQAIQDLQKANVRLLGAVLNKRTFPIPQKIYDRL